MLVVLQELLGELTASGQIVARTKWKDVYPSFSNDKRYLDMLGNPGSNPLELFWDVVDDLDQKLDKKIDLVREAIRKWDEQAGENAVVDGIPNPFKFTPETTKEQYLKVVKTDRDCAEKLAEEDHEEIYKAVSGIVYIACVENLMFDILDGYRSYQAAGG